MIKTAYIGIGSNLGDKLANCFNAIDRVGRIQGCTVTSRSDFFRTEPVGVEGHDWYVNAAISLEAAIPARRLLEELLSIERDLGRKRNKKWEPRTIDLDILLFGRDVTDEKDLTVPHPLMHLRKFVLVPMVQLAPGLIHPLLNQTMTQLLDNIVEDGQAVITLEVPG